MQMYEKRSSARRMFTYFVLIDVVARMGHRGKKEKKKTEKGGNHHISEYLI